MVPGVNGKPERKSNAMRRITEDEARQILAGDRSPAASPELCEATRKADGWLFGPADENRRAPVVVTDAGRVGQLKMGEDAEQAIARLSMSRH